ncbi:1,4-dihydroxy-2-naphthoate polyprenyltransferase [Cellulomonas marina]|uniref:1,4-dihydroxy-2-naphthoate octaprenyltransferase n=1 Tax=Cellulomonas marina TaxID=988821 RepID=A0A1I0XIU5_9CELL|nr:1,4-dihydroxy-2-naphthoate polyprenyltransferase [Cellulomonas marina]GIG30083.1 1,4-dihydroxy-2-naphthoate octaprenyltransferase [Cellulomonas marina]SFB00911.1 1,4-dihydroxy-2-naphthoate octaprenyltransferase [Cellulomonas marina]
MTTAAQWVAGARPRTLPAAVAPVLVGTGAADHAGGAHLGRALLAAGVALALQVGVNYANDYSDGIRGTDADRVGPMRLVASMTARAVDVKRAAFAAFGVAAVLGLVLVVLSGDPWLVLVGAAAIAAAWFYTGGKRPYGYRGLGEVGVFVFFGLVAVLGTTWTQAHALPLPAWLGAVAIGLLACALLMANNLRDVPTDAVVGKRTLAVRLGEHRARRAYAALVVVPVLLGAACAVVAPWSLLVLLAGVPAVALASVVLLGARGRALVPVLAGTGFLELGVGLLLFLGLVVS